MRTLLVFFFSVITIHAATLPSGSVTLAWDYPTNELSPNLTFNLYSTTNVTASVTSWPLLTNIVGTNLQASITVQPGQRFFVMTASNFWMESEFSNVVYVPPLPAVGSNLNIRRNP
jgi:hypothetical protein